jgi:hypothetical protein
MQIVFGDAMANDAFGQVAGEPGDGTLFTFFRDLRRNVGVEHLCRMASLASISGSSLALLAKARD